METGFSSSMRSPEFQNDRPGWEWPVVWAVYLTLSLIMSLPVVLDISQNLGAKGDNILNAWILWRINENLITRPWDLFAGNIFYPYKMVMAYSETMLSGALMVLPAHILGASPVTQYNLLKILAFSLNGLGMYLLACRVTGSRMAGFIGGLIFAFALPRYNLNLQMHCSHFIPFTFWALIRFSTSPSSKRAWALTVFTLLTMLSNAHYALYMVYALAFWVLFEMAWDLGQGWIKKIRLLIIPGLVCGLAALALFWPYLGKPARSMQEVYRYSNEAFDLLRPYYGSWLYSLWLKPSGANQWFFGVIPWLLGLCSIGALLIGRAGRAARYLAPALLLGLLAAWASLGPDAGLYGLMWDHLPGFRGVRGVNRIAMLSFFALSLLAAHGVSILLSRNRKFGLPLTLIVCALILAEAVSIPSDRKFFKLPINTGQNFAWLARRPEVKNILYLPMKYEEVDITYESKCHGKRMVNGYSGYFPPLYNWFKKHQALFPDPAYVRALQAFEVDHVVLDQKLFKRKRAGVEKNPDLEFIAQQDGMALIKVRPKKIKLDRQAIMSGEVDKLWGFAQSDLSNYHLDMQVTPRQAGPVAVALVEVKNISANWLPDGVLQFWARVDAPGGWREALVRMPGLKPGQKKEFQVGALLPWPHEQEVKFRVHLRIENRLHGPEISGKAILGPSATIGVASVKANPEAHNAYKIIDRDITTRWATNQVFKPGEYVELELKPGPVKGIFLLNHGPTAGDHPKGLIIYTSQDGGNWKKLKRIEPLEVRDYTGLEAVWLELPGLEARHLRFEPTHHHPHHWWSLYELVVIKR